MRPIPCKACPTKARTDNCGSYKKCPSWRAWFKAEWAEIQAAAHPEKHKKKEELKSDRERADTT